MAGGFSDEIQVIERLEILPGSGRSSPSRGHLARKRGALPGLERVLLCPRGRAYPIAGNCLYLSFH